MQDCQDKYLRIIHLKVIIKMIITGKVMIL